MRSLCMLLSAFCALACGQIDDSDVRERSLEASVKAAGEYVSTNAREFTLTASAHTSFPPNYDAMSDEEKTRALERAMDRRLNETALSLRRRSVSNSFRRVSLRCRSRIIPE